MNINKKYKDTLFRKIFGEDKNNALSLYNALNGSNYTNPNDLTITTIDDIIYMDIKNDTSYLIDGNLQLTEHQSTYNLNMPVRGFMYYGKLYDQYIAGCEESIYGQKVIKLPNPKYYVLYNGDENCPARVELKLSDAFVHADNSGQYEWTAIMLNINDGYNRNIINACEVLHQYSLFVAKTKELKKVEKTYKDAIIKAVDYCIAHDILKQYLLKNKSEVVDMVLTEYDEEKTMRALRKEAVEEGRKEGEAKGIIKGIISLALSLEMPNEAIIKQLMRQCNLSKEEAMKAIDNFRKEN